MATLFVAILIIHVFGEGVRYMISEGNPLLNKLVNRNTLLFSVVIVLGNNWFTLNSGAMPFYEQQANQFDVNQAY